MRDNSINCLAYLLTFYFIFSTIRITFIHPRFELSALMCGLNLCGIFMTLKNKQSCNGTAYSRKLIIKHRYLFLFGFALFLGIIGLEMLLSVVFRQRKEGKLYLWFIWYNTPDIKLIKLMFHVLASSTMWLFLSKPFFLFFLPSTSHPIRLTVNVLLCQSLAKRFLDFHAWLQL